MTTMHAEEVPVDSRLVQRLLAEQFPHLAHLPVRRVHSTGTVNAIFRVGEHLCARLPRVPAWAADLETELRWLPALQTRLTLRVPEPVGRGRPTPAFPYVWAVYGWIDGRPYDDELVDDERAAAEELARFVHELRAVGAVPGAPPAGRRPLRELDAATRDAIGRAAGALDRAAVTRAWDRAVETPAWAGTPVWIHTDLLRPNVLVDGGQVRAVIDFGGVGVGDPAADVIAAWSVFGADGRAVFRAALDVDDETWERACGFALHQAVMIVPYYVETNPAFVTMAVRTVEQVLADLG